MSSSPRSSRPAWATGEVCRPKGLVTNYGEGGLQNGRGGGHVKFYPYEKGGRKSFSHSEGGAQKVLG